jgi:O-antigen/teichoic acid export membrane protein
MLSLSKLVLSLSLNIYFVAIAQIGVIGIFISNLIAAAFFTLLTYPRLLKKVGFGFSWELSRKLLRFSLPIIPANLASLVVNSSDRYFIKAFISLGEAGIYSLGYRFGSIVFYFVRVPFMQIWEPRRYKLYQEGASPELFARIATYFIGIMCLVGLGIAIFIQDLIRVISPQEFWSAARYAPAVVLCYIIYAFDNHVAFGILVKKKTEYWTYVNFSVAGVNLALNFWWISAFGAWGAIAATLVSVTLKIIGLHLISRRLFYIPFEWGRMTGFLGIAGLIYWLSVAWHPKNFWLALSYDGTCVMIYLSILWVVGLVDLQEKQYLLGKCRRFFGLSGSKLSEPGI